MLLIISLLACAPTDEAPEPDDVAEPGPGLLIEELSAAGAVPQGGTDHYFSDQFVELVNATNDPMDVGGIMIGEVFGAAGEINPGMTPDSFAASHPDDVVLANVWRIPNGVSLDAGATLVVAHDGANHRPFSELDLSGADLEAYVADAGQDADSPTVANLELVHFTGGYDWLMTVFGPSVVVLQADTPLGEVEGPWGPLKTAPITSVIDAVETLMDGESADFKRLPEALDAGHIWVSGTYTGESVHRKTQGDWWQDTDDSGADFEVGLPDPTMRTGTSTASGEPWLVLGTGTTHFEALDGSIELVHGSQGGWHIDVALQFGGFTPDGTVVAYEALDADSAEVLSYATVAELSSWSVLEADDGWERVGDRLVFNTPADTDVIARSIVVRVTADHEGGTISDEAVVTVVDVE